MSQPSGVLATAAVRRPAEASHTWGTDAVFGTNQIPLLSESMKAAPVLDREEAVVGSAAVQGADVVGWDVAGAISTEIWTEGLEPLFLAAMGFENPEVYVGAYGSGSGGSPAFDAAHPGESAYIHCFELDDDLTIQAWASGERAASSGTSTDPTYWTSSDRKVRNFDLAVKKNLPATEAHVFHNCMVQKMTLKFAPEKCTADFDLIGRDRTEAAANYTNWSLGTTRQRILFPHCRLYLQAVGSTMTTEVYFQELEITLENSLKADRQSGSSSEYIIEPMREGTRKVSGTIKIARYDTQVYQAYRDSNIQLQLQLKCDTGTNIAGSINHRMDVVIPALRITGASFPVGGPGVITGEVTFEAERPDSTQAWLTTLLGGIKQVKDNEMLILMSNENAPCFSRDRQYSGVTLP